MGKERFSIFYLNYDKISNNVIKCIERKTIYNNVQLLTHTMFYGIISSSYIIPIII